MRELRLVDRRWRERYSVQRLGEFVVRCRKRGIALTPQRLAVIRALLASENHPSSDEISAAVRRQHPHVSLATVHRILEQFCEVGEARKVTLLHDFARYDGNVEPHHHVLCVRCRRVQDVEIPDVDKLLEVHLLWDSSPCWAVRWKSLLFASDANRPRSECKPNSHHNWLRVPNRSEEKCQSYPKEGPKSQPRIVGVCTTDE